MEGLLAHDWPGNVRELENLCWRLAALAPADSITRGDIESALGARRMGADTEPGGDWKALLAEWARRQLDAGAAGIHADARRDFDQVLLQAALDHADGHRGEAAARLGVGRNTLTRKLKPGQSRR